MKENAIVLVLEWKQKASSDLLAIMDYISDDSPAAAQQLKNDLETKIRTLLEYPRSCKTGRVSGTREMIGRSNYILVYVETAQTVTIVRVLHAAQQWPLHGKLIVSVHPSKSHRRFYARI